MDSSFLSVHRTGNIEALDKETNMVMVRNQKTRGSAPVTEPKEQSVALKPKKQPVVTKPKMRSVASKPNKNSRDSKF